MRARGCREVLLYKEENICSNWQNSNSVSSAMAYLPPHKRHSKDAENPTPVPSSLSRLFKQTLTLGEKPGPQRRGKQRASSQQGGKIVYAAHSISRWWPVGSPSGSDDDDNQIPPSFRLEPVSCESIERRTGGKPLVLAGGEDPTTGGSGAATEVSPWVAIAERIEPDLLVSVQSAREDLRPDTEGIKLAFVARVGKVFFDRNVSLESIRKAAAVEQDSRNQVHKSFNTNISDSYMEDIQDLVAPKIGFDFESEKEHYHVKIFDKCRPDCTISCKCTVVNDGTGLELHKMELNHVRNLVVDLSCLYKDLDLRLMLVTKRILKSTTVEEKDGINELVKSAVFDPDVKGGLRWPLGKDSVGKRFNIVGVWHTKYKAFRGPTLRLKCRHADRFDRRTSTGELSNEVTMKLTGISKMLRDGDLETEPLVEMVRDDVKLIWENLLSYNHPLT